MINPIIQCKSLNCGYTTKPILENIDLTVNPGEIIGIIGTNGCGKTTLLKTITGYLPTMGGTILLNGKPLETCSPKYRSNIIAVVHQTVPNVLITVNDYVTMGRLPFFKKFQFFETSSDHEIVLKYLEMTESMKNKDMLMNELSGGEQQLAQIARALTQEPNILLLDEPTSHLDITHQVRILDLVKRLNKTMRITIIMIIHDLNLASEYCNRLIMIHNSGIYADGTADEVLTPENIENVYSTKVLITPNPHSSKPMVIPITG